MSYRERFIDYVRNGGEGPFVSLQIGGGAGFDTKLAGKLWESDTTTADTKAAYEQVGCEALLNKGMSDFGTWVPSLAWKSETKAMENRRISQRWLDTPYGELRWEHEERPKEGGTPTRYPLKLGDSYDRVYWYLEEHQKALPYVQEALGPVIAEAHPDWPVSIQWPFQPFEMFCLAKVPDVVMMAMTDPEGYRKLCDAILAFNVELTKETFKAGTDFIFLGGPGREMMSPALYEQFMIPDSKVITDTAHAMDGLIYSHICSPVEPFLSKGFYNRMGIDLFETLSPPPVGNVESLAKARNICEPAMCTRGNIGLDVLLEGNPERIREETIRIIEATRGTKHMIAASDYLFYDISLEAVQVMVETAKEF